MNKGQARKPKNKPKNKPTKKQTSKDHQITTVDSRNKLEIYDYTYSILHGTEGNHKQSSHNLIR